MTQPSKYSITFNNTTSIELPQPFDASVPSRRRISGSAEFWPAAENPPKKNTAAENAAEI